MFKKILQNKYENTKRKWQEVKYKNDEKKKIIILKIEKLKKFKNRIYKSWKLKDKNRTINQKYIFKKKLISIIYI